MIYQPAASGQRPAASGQKSVERKNPARKG